jgi:hypothetical protein
MAQAIIEKRLTVKQRRTRAASEGERLVRKLTMNAPASQLDEIVAALVALNEAFVPKKRTKPETTDAAEALLARVHGDHTYTPEEIVELEASNAERSFEARSKVLEGALTANGVKELLGSKSRQIAHDRLKAGTLLGIMERGQWRFPAWQFDADGPNGVVPGLPAVLRELGRYAFISPMGKARFFLRPNPYLGGRTPLEALKQGDVDDVVGVARSIGVS